MSADSLFGAPTRLDPPKRDRWIKLLVRNWLALMGRPPHLLEGDLDDMAPLFANGAKSSLKSRIYALPEADIDSIELPRDVVLIVDGCALITPEGRILLEVLLELERSGAEEISVDRQLFALSTANSLRTAWYSRWLRKQFDSSISVPVLGAALFLLVNGSVGEEHALLLPGDSKSDRELGAVVMPLIADFSRSLGGQAPAVDVGIRQHWVFTQVSRLLGRNVARERTGYGAITYIRRGREANLLDELAKRLEGVSDASRRFAAVSDFTDGYRRVRGSLAVLGQMHEDPTTTRRITDRLLPPGGLP